MTIRRVGILGGTLDPIHCGHLDLGRAAELALQLTDVIVVPSSAPPHRAQPVASSYHRFAMAALAVLGRPHWRASDLELLAAAPSYTAATLERMHEAGYAATELFFLVGVDAFTDIATWKEYPAILDRAHFAVVSRPGMMATDLPGRLPALASRMVAPAAGSLAAGRPSIFLIDARTADVSSTAIRSRRGVGLSIAGLVPLAVQQHIEQHGLYTTTAAEADATGDRRRGAAGRLHGRI